VLLVGLNVLNIDAWGEGSAVADYQKPVPRNCFAEA
jgi:hypothetical protein